MKTPPLFLAAALFAAASALSASAATVTVDSGATWLGYMNYFELPSNGGAQAGQGPWGVADLKASFTGPNLTLSPNMLNDPSNFWYVGGNTSIGNKIMRASMYVEQNGPLSGQSVTFTGNVTALSFIAPYATTAFIKDFAPDYSSFNVSQVPLSATGTFSITLATAAGAGRHVQYGFETSGTNVFPTDPTYASRGSITIAPIPEPSALLLGLIGLGAMARRRR